jgi:hypothetical protein
VDKVRHPNMPRRTRGRNFNGRTRGSNFNANYKALRISTKALFQAGSIGGQEQANNIMISIDPYSVQQAQALPLLPSKSKNLSQTPAYTSVADS